MYNGRYTNISEIIEKVSRYGFSDFNEEETKEWAWEILSKLGVSSVYLKKQALLGVENGRAFIPNDCADLTESQLRDYYSGIIITKTTDTFFPSDERAAGNEGTYVYREIGKSVVYDSNGDLVEDAETFLAEFPPIVTKLKSLTYDINNSQFIFGFDSGIVELTYMAFPIDSNGDPMIPDNAKCIDAVVKYIVERIAFRMYVADGLSRQMYRDIHQAKCWAVSSARSAMNLETIDDWENVFKTIMRLRRDINQQAVGYKTMSVRENLNF